MSTKGLYQLAVPFTLRHSGPLTVQLKSELDPNKRLAAMQQGPVST